MADCALHGADACCTKCPDHGSTDGHGFPHPSEARSRRPLRVCALCQRARLREEWNAGETACAECEMHVEAAREMARNYQGQMSEWVSRFTPEHAQRLAEAVLNTHLGDGNARPCPVTKAPCSMVRCRLHGCHLEALASPQPR